MQTFKLLTRFSTISKKYDLVFVGGGCSTFGFLMNAYRNNKLQELAGKNGIAILEKSNHFGGGTLEENLIPSNTHAIGLARYIMKEKEADMLPSHFEKYLKEGLPQIDSERPNFNLQKVDDGILECFEEMKSTKVYEFIKERSEQTASLQLFGYFLRLAGNTFLQHAQKNNIKIDFIPYTQCQKFLESKQQEDNKYTVKSTNLKSGEETDYNCNKIVMATGGHQVYHPMYDFVPKGKTILSQDFLKQEGFLKAIEILEKNPDEEICIIGGSHSSFSVAYMLLYGPDIYLNDEMTHNTKYTKNRQGMNESSDSFGNIEQLKIHEKIRNYRSKIKKGQIKILHIDDFRLSYLNIKQAMDDGYMEWDSDCVHKYEGCVNAYTGLRGLTKQLFEDIRDKKEERIDFIQFNNVEEVKPIIENSGIVVQCLGYYSNTIPYESETTPNFQYKFDTDKFALMDDKHRIAGLSDVYGVGLGYGIQTHDKLIGGEKIKGRKVRADSLQVYLTRLSTKILNNITGEQISLK